MIGGAAEPGSSSLTRLMTRLTLADPAWAVWKSVERAVTGAGDIDAVAPRSAWPTLTAAVAEWARAERLGPTIVCRHLPATQVDVVCAGSALVQIDLHERAAGVAGAETLTRMTELDDRGFRVVRPGARALLVLLSRARRRRASLLRDDDRREIESLVASDPEGAQALAAELGPLGWLLPRVLRELEKGNTSSRAALELELFHLSCALRDPRQRLSWARYRLGRKCPVLTALGSGRRVPDDRSRWIESVKRTHPVLGET
ncbi:MAG TPA: hypothetical protein VG265_09070 [Gaiellaceae bacterium]|nr:hypothetical protein [Gaiellaceae bacterium]